ncbi:Mss4-like protein [Phialemonium atrogriseum]|uniref:Mss4-like protein n=1 Tax=Phialemonium atrogriseum TaxID=1093897 RepID=A0AAJ0FLQ3_9PEZI|nr:Mss4-like protein [Phialemonium atrogriseum]KAK1772467.1 Mss4-like protein [Phialemonium atrogriseum]
MAEEKAKESGTYEAGCHCGYIKFSVTLSPPLPEYKVLDCNCSMCRKAGYLLIYPHRKDVKWHGESHERCAVYHFNTKQKDQLFCPKCGTSLGIDFRDSRKPKFDGYGISARTLYGIDLDSLRYEKGQGLENVKPSGDLSGIQYELDEKEKALASGPSS